MLNYCGIAFVVSASGLLVPDRSTEQLMPVAQRGYKDSASSDTLSHCSTFSKYFADGAKSFMATANPDADCSNWDTAVNNAKRGCSKSDFIYLTGSPLAEGSNIDEVMRSVEEGLR